MTLIEQYVDQLQNLADNESIEEEAIELVTEAALFFQSLRASLATTGRITENASFFEVAAAVDSLVNENSASVVFLAGLPIDAPRALKAMADSYEKHGLDKDVARILKTSFTALSKKVQDVKTVVEAQKALTTDPG